MYYDEQKYHTYSRHRTTIYQAMADGLDVDIKLIRDSIDADSFASAYECTFTDDTSSYFPVKLIKSCVDYKSSYHSVKSNTLLYSGYDIGRVKDLSVLCAIYKKNKKEEKYILSLLDILKNAPFKDQKSHLLNYLKSYPKAVLNIDKTGIGMNLTEDTKEVYSNRVMGIYFTAQSKEYMAKNLKKMFEDGIISIPNDPALISDIHSIKRRAGTKSFLYDSNRNSYGHADRFWALALACRDLSIFKDIANRSGVLVY